MLRDVQTCMYVTWVSARQTRTPPIGTVSSIVGAHRVPEAIRSLSPMAGLDYVDLFTMTTGEATRGSAEQWARAVLEGTPLGRRARSLWRLLGLRLGPSDSPEYVQGWRIADRGDTWVRVETSAWFATGHAVCQVDDGQVSVALFLRYDRPIAAFIWPPVSVMHRRAMPVLLRQALNAGGPARRAQRARADDAG